jgi:hypothetical protein
VAQRDPIAQPLDLPEKQAWGGGSPVKRGLPIASGRVGGHAVAPLAPGHAVVPLAARIDRTFRLSFILIVSLVLASLRLY